MVVTDLKTRLKLSTNLFDVAAQNRFNELKILINSKALKKKFYIKVYRRHGDVFINPLELCFYPFIRVEGLAATRDHPVSLVFTLKKCYTY